MACDDDEGIHDQQDINDEKANSISDVPCLQLPQCGVYQLVLAGGSAIGSLHPVAWRVQHLVDHSPALQFMAVRPTNACRTSSTITMTTRQLRQRRSHRDNAFSLTAVTLRPLPVWLRASLGLPTYDASLTAMGSALVPPMMPTARGWATVPRSGRLFA